MLLSALPLLLLNVATPTPPPPEEIAAITANDVAIFERGVLTITAPPAPYGTRFFGHSACYAQWETIFEADRFGSRVESTCYGLLDLGNADISTNWSEPIDLIAIVSAELEHLPDSTIQMWNIEIFVVDFAQQSATDFPTIIFDSDGDIID